MSKQQSKQRFEQANKIRKQINNVSRVFQQHLLFMDHKIRKQLSSFSLLNLCGGNQRSKFVIDQRFQLAFNSLNLQQRVNYYFQSVEYAYQGLMKSQKQIKQKQKWQLVNKQLHQQIIFDLLIKKGWSWQSQKVILKQYKIYCSDKVTVDLRNYLLRQSKNHDKKAIVLQSIKNLDVLSIRAAFSSDKDYYKYFPILKRRIQKAHYQNVVKMAQITKVHHKNSDKKIVIDGQLRDQNKPIDIQLGKAFLNIKDQRKSSDQIISKDQKKGSSSKQTKITKENQKRNKNKNKNTLTIQLQDNIEQEGLKPQSILHQILKSSKDQNPDDSLSQLVQKLDMQEKRYSRKNLVNQKQYNQNDNILLQIDSVHKKLHKNLLSTILPDFKLHQLNQLIKFNLCYANNIKTLFIYQHQQNNQIFKLEQKVKFSPQQIIQIISDNSYYKFWHDQVTQGDVKMRLSTDNSIITYQKHKKYSQWYRQRDYLFIRHMFALGDSFYLVQKSIQNSNFFPFYSITRGQINYAVWKIQKLDQNYTSILVQISMNHSGLLKQSYQHELTLRYLKGFQKFESYFQNTSALNKLKSYFDLDWHVDPDSNDWDVAQTVRDSINSEEFQNTSQISLAYQSQINENQIYYSIEDLDQEKDDLLMRKNKSTRKKNQEQEDKKVSIKSKKMKNSNQIISDQPQTGLCVLPNDYIKKKHIMKPLEGTMFPLLKCGFENFVLKDNYAVQGKGALKLIHKKKLEAQSNVFAFILKTLKKNILSGKGMTGVSLPVEIFNVDSMLQRFCYMYSYAPYFIQKACAVKDPIQKAKLLIPFFISTSVIMTDPEKPFNPILGQTYQAIIGGCPIYSEQISHHPPITSTLLYGRGYRLHSSIQQRVNFQINSVLGINAGWTIIEFDDGYRVMYSTPIGGMQGMTYGQRKLVIKGNSLYVDPKNKLVGFLKFQQDSGFFAKSKWKYMDQIEGNLFQVTQDYINQIISSQNKRGPKTAQIIKTIFEVNGRWTQQIRIDGQVMLNYLQHLPYQMQSYPYPLNSNSTYRQDLIYRQKLDIARSQIQKQRLQNVQRHDRKMRAKFHPDQKH